MSKRVRPLHASGYDSFDMFCGAGGFSEGVSRRGVNVKAAANHERICIESHNSNFPLADHYLTDVSVADMRKFPRARLLFASPECFPAGTMILCERGLVPIEEVVEGDRALTHRGRWQPVTRVMCTVKDTILVKGQGHPGLEVTAAHPFLVRMRSQAWDNEKRDYNRRVFGEPAWIKAGDLTAKTYYWATPRTSDPLAIPPVPGRGMSLRDEEDNFWWLVGRWLADGTVRIREDQGGEITLAAGRKKADELEARLRHWQPVHEGRCGYNELRWRRRDVRTAVLFEAGHEGLASWLVEHFGKLAHGKTLPAWALSMPLAWRYALLQGYLSGDGYRSATHTNASTVSKRLAIGIRLLAESMIYRASLHRAPQHATQIEGRAVNVRDLWTVRWPHETTRHDAFADDLLAWSPVRDIRPGRLAVEVFNLSIQDDESYVADGIVVHNCTDWSLAKGARRRNMGQLDLWGDDGLDPAAERTRVTMWDPLRYCDIHDPDGGVIENVTEVPVYWRLWDTWLKGWADLGYETQVLYLNSAFAHPPVRPDGTYSLAAPQSRDRVYVVFKKKGLGKPLNIQIKPWAWCAACGVDVQAIQSWKPHNKYGRKGRYGATKQYVYRCPACTVAVTPYYWCAANAIDWTKRGERIGDRKKPLAPKTVERIRYGLQKFGGHNPFLAGAYHCIPPWVLTTDRPFGTITSQDHHQLVQPEPFVMKVTHAGGTDNRAARVSDRLPTQTSRAEIGLLTPPLVVSNYNGASRHPVRDVSREMPTMATGSGVLNHALVIPPYMRRHDTLDATAVPAFTVQPNGRNNDPRAANDLFPTQTTGLNHALIVPSGGTWADDARPPEEPSPTQTATEAYGILMMARNHNTAKGAEEMFDTVVAGGNHHYLVQPFMLDYKGEPRRVVDALPTQTSVVGDGIVDVDAREPEISPEVEDCYFRMLMVAEVKAAMAFRPDYVILGNQRQQPMQCGQAVTPPVAELLADGLIAALEG